MKLAAIAKLIKADGYCKLYKVFYDDCRTYDLYIGTKTAIFPLTDFPKAQNERELAALLGISEKEWNAILTHMFPLGPVPKNREAWIITMADKICASLELCHIAVALARRNRVVVVSAPV